MAIESSIFTDEHNTRHAEIIGNQMHRVITCGEVRDVAKNTKIGTYTLQDGINRWAASLRVCEDPVRAEEDLDFLREEERQPLLKAAARLAVVQTAADEVRTDELLAGILGDYPNLEETVAAQMDNLLVNGVVDSINWVQQLRARRVKYADIAKHPIFVIGTTLTMESHGALSGILSVAEGGLPETRPQATEILKALGKARIARASIIQTGSSDPRPVDARGFCPAARMRDETGATWLQTLVDQAVELHEATAPKVKFTLPQFGK